MTADRKLSIVRRMDNGSVLVEIVVGREVSLYYVCPCDPFAQDGSRAFLWQGIGRKSASRYECGLTAGRCDCKARVEVCRHVAACRVLVEKGVL
jgi:hypothetical protein